MKKLIFITTLFLITLSSFSQRIVPEIRSIQFGEDMFTHVEGSSEISPILITAEILALFAYNQWMVNTDHQRDIGASIGFPIIIVSYTIQVKIKNRKRNFN